MGKVFVGMFHKRYVRMLILYLVKRCQSSSVKKFPLKNAHKVLKSSVGMSQKKFVKMCKSSGVIFTPNRSAQWLPKKFAHKSQNWNASYIARTPFGARSATTTDSPLVGFFLICDFKEQIAQDAVEMLRMD